MFKEGVLGVAGGVLAYTLATLMDPGTSELVLRFGPEPDWVGEILLIIKGGLVGLMAGLLCALRYLLKNYVLGFSWL